MTHYLRLKGCAFAVLASVYALITVTGSHTESEDYARYAAREPVPYVAPTSDTVPLPLCRNSYIDMSPDERYPIPHWIYSLPEEADKALVLAIAKTESRFKPYARSHRGATGLMQLMPATARYMTRQQNPMLHLASMQVEADIPSPRTPFDFNDPYVSLAVGHQYVEYLQKKRYIGDNVVYTLAAYNAGPANLIKWKRDYARFGEQGFIARIPFQETRNYVRKVMKDYKHYQTLLPEIKETVWVDAGNC